MLKLDPNPTQLNPCKNLLLRLLQEERKRITKKYKIVD
jgi:hypothetical protein